MHFHPAGLLKLLVPAAIVAAVLIGRAYIGLLENDLRIIIDYLPYLICAIVMLMTLLFSRSRLMLAALGIAAFYWTVQEHLQVRLTEHDALQVYLSLSLTLPVLTLFLLLAPERGTGNVKAFLLLTVFLMLTALCMQLGPWLYGLNDVTQDYYRPQRTAGYILSFGASLLVALVGLVGALLLCVRDEEVDAALLSAFVALYLSLALLHVQHVSVAMSSAAALCLVWGLLRSSHSMAYRDELTGLPGRRALNERLRMLSNRYSIAMLDVDHFKRFNDTYGHDVGDEVLRLVASRIRRVGGGTAYRYGGEEFCVVFPRTNVESAAAQLEQVREAIANYSMSIRNRSLRPARAREGSKRRGATRIGSSQVSVTISGGVAERSNAAPDADAVVVQADKLLYRAKKAGRNRIAYE
ncbi:MAG: GGDEF domain-containing protein [Halioglobus sp.]|nr:GGDEF domain-containing protein [Halioglobus sp.]